VTRLVEIQARIDTMRELSDIVGALRSLAGMRLQETQNALPGVRRYAESVAAALVSARSLMPEPETGASINGEGRRAFILCSAEHGFVGGFNERLVDAAQAALVAKDALLVLGTRGAALAHERGPGPVWARPMATRLAGVPETINCLSAELYARIARREVTRAEIMFARYRQGGAPAIERRTLLPLDVEPPPAKQSRQPPLHNLKPLELYEKLMAEYVFALLTEAAVESIASENAARFAAMESAHDNVSRKLDELRQEARIARQSEITTELIDLVTGAEAMNKG
jgi:F-type H+-transporting ATPase subunit gamma